MNPAFLKKIKRNDRLAHWVITGGGLAIIFSVIFILVLIAKVSLPLFYSPSAELYAKVTLEPARRQNLLALGAIPREMREGAYALGATKFQTLYRVLLPMASPGIMTGLILAMARAAGEVAPLMITGVVKLAPALPIDGNFPFFHLDRKFMHLGFHIYDIGFQSPNVEAAKPMVFVTTLLLLVLIVLLMSSVAIRLRNKMKKRYSFGTF